MSHQTGIKPDEELRTSFATCKHGGIRILKISIRDEKLVLEDQKSATGVFEDDYSQEVLPLLEEHQPCFLFVRFDSKTSVGYEWLFVAFCPESAPIKQKMLYASTKATLKQEFGASQIKDELFATAVEEASLEGYKKHIKSKSVPKPRTQHEEELEEVKRSERGVGVDPRHQTMQGLAFPISDEAMEKIFDMRDGTVGYVQFSIDIANEMINLEDSGNFDVCKLGDKVPSDQARYHLFKFPHTHEGDFLESIVFIYSMPGYSCSVKERMLYSSCKGPFVQMMEEKVGIPFARKIEVDSGSDLTEDFLKDELHPQKDAHRQQFSKPKGPASRGPRRLIR